jgi:gas vesicle protein
MLLEELMMNTPAVNGSTNHFFLGLVTGSVVGAALAIAFAPRLASELRQRVATAAADLGDAAAKGYRDASTRIVGAVDDATARGQAVQDDVADAVVRGARSVEQFAAASKTGRS